MNDLALAPDARAAQAFLNWWFAGCVFGDIEVGWIDASSKTLNRFRLFALDDPGIGEFVETINKVPGQSAYYRAATVHPEQVGHTMDTDFAEAPGIWLDQDDPTHLAQGNAVSTCTPPHAWIITGRHPHLRRQGYMRFAQPLADRSLVRSLNVRFRALYGGDDAVVNPTSLMRLPGTIAWPRKPGRIVEITEWIVPPMRSDHTYTLKEVITALPLDRAQEQPACHAMHGGCSFSPVQHATRPERPLTRGGGYWHNDMISLTARQVVQGMTDQEILARAPELTKPGYTLAQTVREMQRAIDGARRKWDIPNMSRFERAQAEFEAEPVPSTSQGGSDRDV